MPHFPGSTHTACAGLLFFVIHTKSPSLLPHGILCPAIQVGGVFTVREQYSREKSFQEKLCCLASLRPNTRALQAARSSKSIPRSLFPLEPTPSNFPVMHFSHFLALFHHQVNLFLLNPPSPSFPSLPLENKIHFLLLWTIITK